MFWLHRLWVIYPKDHPDVLATTKLCVESSVKCSLERTGLLLTLPILPTVWNLDQSAFELMFLQRCGYIYGPFSKQKSTASQELVCKLSIFLSYHGKEADFKKELAFCLAAEIIPNVARSFYWNLQQPKNKQNMSSFSFHLSSLTHRCRILYFFVKKIRSTNNSHNKRFWFDRLDLTDWKK